ncbi:unnamed protein product, partial [Ilex paraguariensis]
QRTLRESKVLSVEAVVSSLSVSAMAPKRRRTNEGDVKQSTTSSRVTRSSTSQANEIKKENSVPPTKVKQQKKAKTSSNNKEEGTETDNVKAPPAKVVDGTKTIVIEHW